MNNAEIFAQTFGIYATEMWAMPESEFLSWLNSLYDVNATNTTDTISREKLQTQLNCVDRLQITIDGRAIEVIPRWNVNKIIESLPSAEPQIIRCKDCIHWKHSNIRFNYCDIWQYSNQADDFCSFAERREEE